MYLNVQNVTPRPSVLQLPLLEKKRQLLRQLSEAQDLKDHVDRREQAVSRVLARCLTPEQHRDYRYIQIQNSKVLLSYAQSYSVLMAMNIF